MYRYGLVLLLVGAFTLSCAVTGATPAPAGEAGILFQDDFSDSGSGWDQVSFETGVTDYADGVYRIYVNEPTVDYWANPGLNFGDVRVEVEAIIPDADPSEPCLEPQIIRYLDDLQAKADRGLIDELARVGDVYVRQSA